MNHCHFCGNNIPDEFDDCRGAGYACDGPKLNNKPSQQEEIERIMEEFDAKFFIGGTNALGEEKPLLFPAKVEVRDWLRTTLTSLTEAHKVEMEKMVEEERVRLLFLAQSVLKELNNSYSINIKYADKKQWVEPEEFERIFLHRFNDAGIEALTPTPEHLPATKTNS